MAETYTSIPPSPVAPPPSLAASSELENNESDVDVDDDTVAQFTMIPPRLITTQRAIDEDTSPAPESSADIPAFDERSSSPSLKSDGGQINTPSTFLENRPPTPMPLNRAMHTLRRWVTVFEGLHQGVFDINSAPPFVHGNIEGDGYKSFTTKAEAASAWYDHLREHGMDNLTTVSASSPFPIPTYTSCPSSSEHPLSSHNTRPLTPPASQDTVDEEGSALHSNASIKITATVGSELDSVSTGNPNDMADNQDPGSDAAWPDAGSEGTGFASQPPSVRGDSRDGSHPLPGAGRDGTGGFGAGGPGAGGSGTAPFAGHGFSGPNYPNTSPPFSISVSGIVPPACPYIFFNFAAGMHHPQAPHMYAPPPANFHFNHGWNGM